MNITTFIARDADSQANSLWTHFLELNKCEQAFLFVLSVIYKPVTVSKLDSVMRHLVSMGFLNRSVRDDKLTKQRSDELVELSLLTNEPGGVRIHPLLVNTLTRNLSMLDTLSASSTTNHYVNIVHAAEQVVPVFNVYTTRDQGNNERRIIRDLYFLGERDSLDSSLELTKDPLFFNLTKARILVELLFLTPNLEAFDGLSHNVTFVAFSALFKLSLQELVDCSFALVLLEQMCEKQPDNLLLRQLLGEQYLYQLRFDDFSQLGLKSDSKYYGLQLHATFCLLTGEIEQAVDYYAKALLAKNKLVRRKKQYLGSMQGYFYKLALLIYANQHNAAYFDRVVEQIENQFSHQKDSDEFAALGDTIGHLSESLSASRSFHLSAANSLQSPVFSSFIECLDSFTQVVACVWCNDTGTNHGLKRFQVLAGACKDTFDSAGLPLFTRFAEQVLGYCSDTEMGEVYTDTLIHLPSQIIKKAHWEHALEKLIALGPKMQTSDAKTEQKPQRLIWELHQGRFTDSLIAKEQKRNKNGWSKGRVVSLQRLYKDVERLDYLSDTDKALCRAITPMQGYDYYNSKTYYELEGLPALIAAVGIDNLYLPDSLEHPIQLTQSEPGLMVSEQGDKLCLSMTGINAHTDCEINAYHLQQSTPTMFNLVVFSDAHKKVAKILGDEGLLIPASAKSRALEGIAAIAPLLDIQSDVGELETGLAIVDAQLSLTVNIQPLVQNEGLEFVCLIMPFGEQGPAYKPGVGNTNVTAEVGSERLATKRNLLAEQIMLDKLDTVCPAFLAMPGNVLRLDDLQDALIALEQLEQAVTNDSMPLAIRWPKGKKYTLSAPLTHANLQLALAKNRSEWFDISGEVCLDNEDVISLQKLLQLMASSNGRYVQLDAQRIIALSDELREKLALLNEVTDKGQFHPLASLHIEEATTGMRMKTIHAWDKQTQRMHEANTIEPKVPSTLQASLRDYQKDGFDWAMRLAHWGAGACLADDMGLGKTLQALAVILARASNGPSLVIAPTSVCFNWQHEAFTFAPTLQIHMFSHASTAQQRQTMLTNLGPFDCVIVSYGLLQRESEMLQNTRWHTLVADEAQAIKNPLAKRTKAAYALKADFRMITTGTPIENDLTELWSLFRFVNPGLLGNLKRFALRFINPIDNAKEDRLAAHRASQSLRSLTRPFILRRLKHQVLTELPARTEVTLAIELSDKEQAFYEAIRLNAINNISQAQNINNSGEQRIRMLAELVKLRQACCNPKLIMQEAALPSAKLAALDTLLEELLLNKHKALIFSQFVGHLQLIKEHLQNKGIAFQYLDGSTPLKQREASVMAFQKGEGDVFLISLKAGGTGLNLTAADYVIHMDPWWNPAVEDQASDRAHRMGQKRSVTIYRMIAKNTIEEKIVALHQNKRELADKLLSGTNHATRLSVDDMLGLLKETF